MEQEYLKLRWQKAIISEHGPERMTRHTLLVLSVFMDMDGKCFPSTVNIARAAKVSLRSVITHLEKAEHDGWIKKMIAGLNGQGWKRNKYKAMIPDNVVQELHRLNKKGSANDDTKVVQELHRLNKKGSATGAEGSANYDKKVVQGLHSNIPIEHTKEHTTDQCVFSLYEFYITEINPLRKSSYRAKKNIAHYLKKHSFDDLKKSILNYKSNCGDDPKYRKDPANFFGKTDAFFLDYLPDNFEPPKKETYDPFKGCDN